MTDADLLRSHILTGSKTGYRCVYRKKNRYRGSFRVNGERHTLPSSYATPRECAAAVAAYMREKFGRVLTR